MSSGKLAWKDAEKKFKQNGEEANKNIKNAQKYSMFTYQFAVVTSSDKHK